MFSHMIRCMPFFETDGLSDPGHFLVKTAVESPRYCLVDYLVHADILAESFGLTSPGCADAPFTSKYRANSILVP